MKPAFQNPTLRMFSLALLYSLFLSLSLYLAYNLRFDFQIPDQWASRFWQDLLWLVPLKLVLLFLFGQFRGILSYFRFPDLYRLFSALTLPALLAVLLWYGSGGAWAPPRSVILGDLLCSFVLLAGFRSLLRIGRERRPGLRKPLKRTAIIGAGDAGAQMTADLLAHPWHGFIPVLLLDDDPQKQGRNLHGVPILGPTQKLREILPSREIEEIIIAAPSASPKTVAQWFEEAQALGFSPKTIPSLAQLTDGTVTASLIRPIQIEDLLGREPVALEIGPIRQFLKDQVILVTGAGGTIGTELCRQILAYDPARLILIDQAENALFTTQQQLQQQFPHKPFRCYLRDILNREQLEAIFQEEKPTILFHAAAHKHVPLLEDQPLEALRNNFLGTVLLANLAIKYGLAHFIFISTDKAINPTSVMGASKRLAELALQAKQQEVDSKPKFSAVRFGNVLGSSGSVVPLFREQIAHGGPVTVTDPEVTRYFMTEAEAVGLVLQAATQGAGGEIFVLDMGEPVKIVDLARQMIELSGYRPDIDIEIEFIGLRPGEKLFEELQHASEAHEDTQHPKIRRFLNHGTDAAAIRQFIEELENGLGAEPRSDLKGKIQTLVPEYKPFLD